MTDTGHPVRLTLDDSRRLTGKGLLWDQTGAIIDAFISGIDKKEFISVWEDYARQLLEFQPLPKGTVLFIIRAFIQCRKLI